MGYKVSLGNLHGHIVLRNNNIIAINIIHIHSDNLEEEN